MLAFFSMHFFYDMSRDFSSFNTHLLNIFEFDLIYNCFFCETKCAMLFAVYERPKNYMISRVCQIICIINTFYFFFILDIVYICDMDTNLTQFF